MTYRRPVSDPWQRRAPAARAVREIVQRDQHPDRPLPGGTASVEYVRPDGLTRHIVIVDGLETVASSVPGAHGFATGSRVLVNHTLQGPVVVGTPPPGERRTADRPLDSTGEGIGFGPRIDTADPQQVARGETTAVEVTGANLTAGMELRAVTVRGDGTTTPYPAAISVTAVASSQAATLSVTVDAAAPLERWGVDAR